MFMVIATSSRTNGRADAGTDNGSGQAIIHSFGGRATRHKS
jgi:hypothetical protein